MEAHKPKRSLKNLLINPNFQAKYITNYVCVGLIAVGLNYFLVLSKLNIFIDQLGAAQITNTVIKMDMANLITSISLQSLLAFLLTVIFSVAMALFMSHRIAGASYAIEKYIKDLKEGRYDETRYLRKNDDLQSVMAALQDLAKTLKEKEKGR